MNEQQTQRMQEIKARYTATTQCEWKATKSECACESYECDRGVSRYEASERACSGCDGFAITEGASVIGPREVDCGEYSYYTDEDAEFMAGAHQDIPWLIEQLEALQREQEERENPKPLTCDGCRFQGPPYSARCAACCRSNEDRYEPKGED